MKFLTGSYRKPVLNAPPSIEVNFKHDCINGCRCFPTVSTCSFTLELPVHTQNEEEMLSVFSTTLVADVGFGRCQLFYQIKLVLINCIYNYCIFLHQCNGLFLKVSYLSAWKVICQYMFCCSFREKQSLRMFFKTPVPQTIKLKVCAQNLRKISGKEFHFIKITCLQSGILLEIKLINKYFPIASSASASIYFVEHLLVAAYVYDTRRKT